jgi:hypothetical protein
MFKKSKSISGRRRGAAERFGHTQLNAEQLESRNLLSATHLSVLYSAPAIHGSFNDDHSAIPSMRHTSVDRHDSRAEPDANQLANSRITFQSWVPRTWTIVMTAVPATPRIVPQMSPVVYTLRSLMADLLTSSPLPQRVAATTSPGGESVSQSLSNHDVNALRSSPQASLSSGSIANGPGRLSDPALTIESRTATAINAERTIPLMANAQPAGGFIASPSSSDASALTPLSSIRADMAVFTQPTVVTTFGRWPREGTSVEMMPDAADVFSASLDASPEWRAARVDAALSELSGESPRSGTDSAFLERLLEKSQRQITGSSIFSPIVENRTSWIQLHSDVSRTGADNSRSPGGTLALAGSDANSANHFPLDSLPIPTEDFNAAWPEQLASLLAAEASSETDLAFFRAFQLAAHAAPHVPNSTPVVAQTDPHPHTQPETHPPHSGAPIDTAQRESPSWHWTALGRYSVVLPALVWAGFVRRRRGARDENAGTHDG